jgi:hypothetical protein
MSGCTLYIKNETEELVGSVHLSNFDLLMEKIVVDDYTREEHVFNLSCTNVLKCTDTTATKFEGFAKYLRDRKKIAVAKLPNKCVLYIMPPRSGNLAELQCRVHNVEAPPPPRASATNVPQLASMSASSTGGGFLSSLLTKVCCQSRDLM